MKDLKKWLQLYFTRQDVREWVSELLIELCAGPTYIQRDVKALKKAEEECFRIIERSILQATGNSYEFSYHKIHTEISEDEYYTVPAYTDEKDIYCERYNATVFPRANYNFQWLLNSHIDVVPPYFPPRIENGIIHGRGSNDNKGGNVVSILLLKMLKEWKDESGEDLLDQVGITFSIDEEIGGNGSLSLTKDVHIKGKSVVVLEPTQLVPFPANRGALWFKILIRSSITGLTKFLYRVSFAIIRELVGTAIYIRENHPHTLFDDFDVQLCIGILETYGKFPASACEQFVFRIRKNKQFDIALLRDECNNQINEQELLRKYLKNGSHKDHIEIVDYGNEIELKVNAVGGHMGSRTRGADALVKSAFLIEHLIERFNDDLLWNEKHEIRIEGGLGFLPSLKIIDVKNLILKVINQVEVEFQSSFEGQALEIETTFDKIHNEAYCSDDDAPGFNHIVEALHQLDIRNRNENLVGWQASCDARIFARESGDVTTFGAGALENAHGPDEFVVVDDIIMASSVLVAAIRNRSLND